MRHSVEGADPGLFRQAAHSPSVFELNRRLGDGGRPLVDFCIPCNPYFPTPEMFGELAKNLEMVLKFYPSDADTIAGQLARVLGLNPATIAMSNGSTELITWMDHLWFTESVAVPIPTSAGIHKGVGLRGARWKAPDQSDQARDRGAIAITHSDRARRREAAPIQNCRWVGS